MLKARGADSTWHRRRVMTSSLVTRNKTQPGDAINHILLKFGKWNQLMKSKGANWREFATKKLGNRTSTHKRINKHSDTHTHAQWASQISTWCKVSGKAWLQLHSPWIFHSLANFRQNNISDLFVLHGETKAWTCVLCAHTIYTHSLPHFFTSRLALGDGNTLAVLWV